MQKTKKDPATNRTIVEKLDTIIDHMERMDRRDRWRTIGGFFKGIIGIIPVVVLLASVWYTINYGEQLLEKIAQQAAKQATEMRDRGTENLRQQLEGLFNN